MTDSIHCVVHTFLLADTEDPDLYCAQPIWEWQQSPAGKWVMENSETVPVFRHYPDTNTLSYKFEILATFSLKNHTYYSLAFK